MAEQVDMTAPAREGAREGRLSPLELAALEWRREDEGFDELRAGAVPRPEFARWVKLLDAVREAADLRRGGEGPCSCGHGRLFHTFAPGGESLCDLCGCEAYRGAEVKA